jgi:hypothetical protein
MKAFMFEDEVVVAENWDEFVEFTKQEWEPDLWQDYKEVPIYMVVKTQDGEMTIDHIVKNHSSYNGKPLQILSGYA